MGINGLLLPDATDFYNQFVQNESFRRFVTDMVHLLPGSVLLFLGFTYDADATESKNTRQWELPNSDQKENSFDL